jgi:nucleotide-binding universal stress UspA family protein
VEEGEMSTSIVVGVDGTETSRRALEKAATIATADQLEVVAVYVRHVPLAGLSMWTPGAGQAIQEIIDEMEIRAEADSVMVLEPAGVRWHFEVRTGEPSTELIRVAEEDDADTIVVAGRQHGAIGGFAHGSVIAQLLHRWPHCLMVIHPDNAAVGDRA